MKKQFTEDQVRLFELDVTNTAECAQSLSKLLEEEGTVDVLVNNAGITRDSVLADGCRSLEKDDWD